MAKMKDDVDDGGAADEEIDKWSSVEGGTEKCLLEDNKYDERSGTRPFDTPWAELPC